MPINSIALQTLRFAHTVARHLPSAGRFRPLRGAFSAYQALRDGEIEGGILMEQQEPGTCPPGSITERCGMRQHDHQPWPIFWTRADDARLVAKLLNWRDSNDRICLEGCHYFTGRRRLSEDQLLAQLIVPPAKHLEGAWTSIVSYWGEGHNYYHWITDALTRLMIREQLPEPTRVLIPNSTAPYVRESLEMLGIFDVCEMREENCLRPERFYFSSPLAMTGAWNPLGWDWLRERFNPYFRAANSGRPVFLTRRAAKRVPAELERIEALFLTAGFDILDCGKVGFREQIEAASSAPAISGIHGAAMTNILWSRPGTPVLEIFQPQFLVACYEQIAFHGQLDYTHHVLEGESPLRAIEQWLVHEGYL